MRSYLTNRQQRGQVNSNFSTSENVITRVPQGTILGPLLFNNFVNDLFLFVSNSYLSNYADDNTLYAFGHNLEEIKNTLRFGLCALVRTQKMKLSSLINSSSMTVMKRK